jgi:hypothetical protein
VIVLEDGTAHPLTDELAGFTAVILRDDESVAASDWTVLQQTLAGLRERGRRSR